MIFPCNRRINSAWLSLLIILPECSHWPEFSFSWIWPLSFLILNNQSSEQYFERKAKMCPGCTAWRLCFFNFPLSRKWNGLIHSLKHLGMEFADQFGFTWTLLLPIRGRHWLECWVGHMILTGGGLLEYTGTSGTKWPELSCIQPQGRVGNVAWQLCLAKEEK